MARRPNYYWSKHGVFSSTGFFRKSWWNERSVRKLNRGLISIQNQTINKLYNSLLLFKHMIWMNTWFCEHAKKTNRSLACATLFLPTRYAWEFEDDKFLEFSTNKKVHKNFEWIFNKLQTYFTVIKSNPIVSLLYTDWMRNTRFDLENYLFKKSIIWRNYVVNIIQRVFLKNW